MPKPHQDSHTTRKARQGPAQRRQRPDLLRGSILSGRTEPDWNTPCDVCGATPTVPATGMCGPCTFGEAATAGGNW